MDLWQLGLLFLVGSFAGFINVMAGGGSTITLPVLIFMGLNSALANGTNRLAIFIQNIFAIWSFRRQRVHAFRESLKLSVWTLPGAIAGALLAVRISDVWFQRILALVMIAIVVSMFLPGAQYHQSREDQPLRKSWFIYPALFGIGFYGGFIQAGVGFLFMAALYHLLKVNLVYVNMHKVFIVFIYMFPTLLIFIVTGNVDWLMGLSLAAGNAFGAWWSARLAVRGGEKVIRWVLAIALILMAGKLLGIYG
ncbi:MAG: sulfite exporter TauE/SafE family protein [Calditrichaeota bacterium]|nr:sulfite exporter TauE/SafE family protein [Calditrichota bacterium]